MKPKIGVIPNRKDRVTDDYLGKLRDAGADPVVLALTEFPETMAKAVKKLAGLLLPGGGDFSEPCYENLTVEKKRTIQNVDGMRETAEWLALDAAKKLGRPVFGICRGYQAMNVHAGGTLMADIHLELEGREIPEHRPPKTAEMKMPDHDVFFEPESELGHLVSRTSIATPFNGRIKVRVNNSHHQAVLRVGAGLRPVAWAGDDIIEAVEGADANGPFWFGVQFHPERLQNDLGRRLFERFVKAVTVSA